MPLTDYKESTLTREEVDRFQGPVVMEFGASWCGICQGFTPKAESAFASFQHVRHVRIEDGPGKRLGRSFKVKLWPTFIFMLDGNVVQTSVRPTQQEVTEGLTAIGGNMDG